MGAAPRRNDFDGTANKFMSFQSWFDACATNNAATRSCLEHQRFQDWHDKLQASGENDSKWANKFISAQCWFDLQLAVNGMVSALANFSNQYGEGAYTKTSRFSQNGLEGFFGFVRARSFSSSVSAVQYASQVANFRAQRGAAAANSSVNYGAAQSSP